MEKHIFKPTPEQAAQIKRIWHSEFNLRYALAWAEGVMGWPVTRNQLTYAFGNRYKREDRTK